ncbi:hypothetical protein Tco_1031535 [Tanacetum coccineum]|uniref:Uncharacterized protein n=1 Tax=Tanacetum coccineum TaxID=301880 RepID=A0ABQ5G9H7_9ASTR
MDFVNELGYPKIINFVSKMHVNNLYQPWRAMLTLINQCLTGKTYGSDKPRHPVLQMLWGYNIHQRPEYPVHVTGDEFPLGNLKFVPKGEKDKDDTSANVVHDTPSPVDAETRADTDKTNSKDEDQAGSNPRQSHVALAGANPEPMYEDFTATVYVPTLKRKQGLGSDCSSFLHQFFYVENHDLYSKIDKYINENVKEAVQDALQAPIRERFRELSEFEMKEILRDWMFKSDSYRSLPEHTTFYEALEASMDRENREQFMDATVKSRKRCHDDQDSLPHPLKDSDQNDMHLSDSEDTDADHLPKIKTRLDWLKPILKKKRTETYKTRWMEECHLLLTDKIDLTNPEGNRVMLDVSKPLPLGGPPGQVTIQTQYFFNKDLEYLVSGDKERRSALSISKLKAAYYQEFGLDELVPSLWIESERDYDISIAPRIAHWADNQDYKISEADFKNLHPNDFEDLYLLHLQGKLNHLSGSDKVTLFNAVNLWIRNIIIKHHMEDLQLGVEQLKAFSWSWDELVVSMQCPQGNPSLSLALQHSQPSMGSSGCVIAKLAKLIRLGPVGLEAQRAVWKYLVMVKGLSKGILFAEKSLIWNYKGGSFTKLENTVFDLGVMDAARIVKWISSKRQKIDQNVITEHGMEKTVITSRPKTKKVKVKVNPEDIQAVKRRAGTEEYYCDAILTI